MRKRNPSLSLACARARILCAGPWAYRPLLCCTLLHAKLRSALHHLILLVVPAYFSSLSFDIALSPPSALGRCPSGFCVSSYASDIVLKKKQKEREEEEEDKKKTWPDFFFFFLSPLRFPFFFFFLFSKSNTLSYSRCPKIKATEKKPKNDGLSHRPTLLLSRVHRDGSLC